MQVDLEQLDQEIRRAHIVVIALILLVLAGYMVWFGMWNSQVLSSHSDAWAHFGAFVGGLFGPLVAYAAFYWLTKAVRLQKEELSYTRQVLKETSEAQSQHAEYAKTSVNVAALSALIDSMMGEVQVQRLQLQFVVDQMRADPNSARSLDGQVRKGRKLQEFLGTLNRGIEQRMTERMQYQTELKRLLGVSQPNKEVNADAGNTGAA